MKLIHAIRAQKGGHGNIEIRRSEADIIPYPGAGPFGDPEKTLTTIAGSREKCVAPGHKDLFADNG
jgi:hypothetical protein